MAGYSQFADVTPATSKLNAELKRLQAELALSEASRNAALAKVERLERAVAQPPKVEQLQDEIKALREMIGEIDRQHAVELERLRSENADLKIDLAIAEQAAKDREEEMKLLLGTAP